MPNYGTTAKLKVVNLDLGDAGRVEIHDIFIDYFVKGGSKAHRKNWTEFIEFVTGKDKATTNGSVSKADIRDAVTKAVTEALS